MDKREVVSSNIQTIGFESDTLFLRFKSGQSYSYDHVDRGVFEAMTKAESVGKFFHRFVRNKYRHHRLERDPFMN